MQLVFVILVYGDNENMLFKILSGSEDSSVPKLKAKAGKTVGVRPTREIDVQAIEAYAKAHSIPKPEQLKRLIEAWGDAIRENPEIRPPFKVISAPTGTAQREAVDRLKRQMRGE